jgi:hypothetical protein
MQICTACTVRHVNLYSLYCKTCKFVQCTNLHVLQYKLYTFTCLIVQAAHIYMSYSTSCGHLHILQCQMIFCVFIYVNWCPARFLCQMMFCVFIYVYWCPTRFLCQMMFCEASTVRHVNLYSLYCKTCKFVQLVL